MEYSAKVRTSFSKLKIMQTAIPNFTTKCGVLVDFNLCRVRADPKELDES